MGSLSKKEAEGFFTDLGERKKKSKKNQKPGLRASKSGVVGAYFSNT
jgi:hypothetical protein